MPVAPTYPGVYVEELPSGVHTITGVSTSVTAFLGFFTRGPMNTAVRVFGVADLERTFGSLDTRSEAGYGVRQFFANGGGEAWVVRVASGTPLPAGVQIASTPGGGAILKATATGSGLWGNSLRLHVDFQTLDPKRFNLTVLELDASVPAQVVSTETFRNLTLDSADPNFAPAVVNDGSALVTLAAVNNPAATALPAANGTVGKDIHTLNLAMLSSTDIIDVTLVTGSVPAGTALGGIKLPTPLPTTVAGLASALQASLRSLGAALASATVTVVGSASTSQVLVVEAGASAKPDAIVKFTDHLGGTLAMKLGLSVAAQTNVQLYALGSLLTIGAQVAGTAGADGAAPDASALIGSAGAKTGLHALDTVDVFNILCLPDVMNLADTNASAVITAAEGYCSARRAFYILDVPQLEGHKDTIDGIAAWLDQNATARNKNTALYYPRPQIPDPLNAFRLRTVAPSGTIAGLYARIDGSRGVWKAPAGTEATLTGVVSLATKLTDAENGSLNPAAINCLRTFPVYGNTCWGARTLDGADQLASDWKYIPVRRTALFIEESLFRGTQWVVFEPNDEPLWSQIRLNLGAFMQGLFRRGAFQGATPRQAYFVKCDAETTTQADINLGMVNIVVGFAPLKPAEFVVIQIQQIAGQIPT